MDKFEVRRQRLMWLRDNRCDGVAAVLAKRIDKEPSYISRMLYPDGKPGKKRIAEDTAEIIEKAFDLPKGWLSELDSPDMRMSDHLPGEASRATDFAVVQKPFNDGDSVNVTLLSAKASMGQGSDLVYEGDQIIGLMPLSKEWIHRNIKAPPDALRVITGAGDSMEPTFGSGDMLLVDTSKTVIDIDGVYVLSAHNRLFIKRVRQRMSGDFEISSDNPTVKTVDILNGDNPVAVHGRVVWAWNGKSM